MSKTILEVLPVSPLSKPNSPATVVVGIGASAGGVEALNVFLDHERANSGAAFLIAMHLPAGRTSHLPAILARHTDMNVRHAEHEMLIEKNNVYILPPGMIMTADKQQIQLTQANPDERTPTAIDRLFNSLAQAFSNKAIGVVLSGTGSDSALGLRAIRDRGGLTIAQVDGGTAPMFSGMPQSAIAIGAIDLLLSIEDIGPRLLAAVKSIETDTASPGNNVDDPHEPLRIETRCGRCQLRRF